MEALEFLKAAKRRYESNKFLYGDIIDLDGDFNFYIKQLEQWLKVNPVKTRQSEFLKMFPNVEIKSDGIIDIAPCNLEKGVFEKCEKGLIDCEKCYREFWSKEVE